MESFIQNIKMLRKATKTPQQDLAAALGLSVRTYQSYEYGENDPSLNALVKLADFYDITLDELVGRTRKQK